MEEFGDVFDCMVLFVSLLMHENRGDVSRIMFWLLITKNKANHDVIVVRTGTCSY